MMTDFNQNIIGKVMGYHFWLGYNRLSLLPPQPFPPYSLSPARPLSPSRPPSLPPSLPLSLSFSPASGSPHGSLLMKGAAMLGAPCGRPQEEAEAFRPVAHEELKSARGHIPERKTDGSSPSWASRWDGSPIRQLTSSSVMARSRPVETGRWHVLFWVAKFG